MILAGFARLSDGVDRTRAASAAGPSRASKAHGPSDENPPVGRPSIWCSKCEPRMVRSAMFYLLGPTLLRKLAR